MKKATLVWVLLLFVAVVFAQSSLYDLEPNLSYDETMKLMKTKGFQQSQVGDGFVYFNEDSTTEIPEVHLFFSSGTNTLSSWKLRYDLKTNPDMKDTILAALTALHGECSVEYDYDCDFIWYFSGDRAIYVTIYDGSSMLLEYSYGNWDDDDYEYYGEW